MSLSNCTHGMHRAAAAILTMISTDLPVNCRRSGEQSCALHAHRHSYIDDDAGPKVDHVRHIVYCYHLMIVRIQCGSNRAEPSGD